MDAPTTVAVSALRAVAGPYLAVVRRYGRFPFRLALASVLLFGPLALAFEAALLLRIEAALAGPLPVPAVAGGVGTAAALYSLEYAAVRRLADRTDEGFG